ncbi:MAG: caspase family protein [Armatimonadota bacterium]
MFKNKVSFPLILIIGLLSVYVFFISGCGGNTSAYPQAQYTIDVPSPQSPTASPTPTPERDLDLYAVIVGIKNYPKPYTLKYPVEDAKSFYKSLRESPLWSGAFVSILYDSDATKENVQKYMEDAAGRLKEGAMFVFYFSGQGSNYYGTTGCLLLYGGDLDLEERITEDALDAWLAAIPASCKKYIVIDACYSGAFIDKGAGPGIRTKFIPVESSYPVFKGDYTGKILAHTPNMAAITSSKWDQKSYESDTIGHSFMTYYLVQGLGTGAAIGPAAPEGATRVTAEESYIYAAPRVSEAVLNIGLTQDIQIQDNYTGDMVVKNI